MRLDHGGGAARHRDAASPTPMGLTVEEAAAGMYRVACNNMAQGVREVTIKRGYDPREFPLRRRRRRRADPLLPDLQRAGNSAADRAAFVLGAVRLRHAAVRAQARFRAHLRCPARQRSTGDGSAPCSAEMRREGEQLLAEERIAPAQRRYRVRFDCRYLKQYHEVSFDVPLAAIEARDTASIAPQFPRRAQPALRLYRWRRRKRRSS